MMGQTLFAAGEPDSAGATVLETEDRRFSVDATWWGQHEPGFRYLLLRTTFRSSDPRHSFGVLAIVVDDEGALLQMVVAEDVSEANERVRARMKENDIDLDETGERLAGSAIRKRTSALASANEDVTIRARAYSSEQLEGESLVCLRVVFAEFGAVQLVVSDLGRLMAMATGRHERQAYQRVCHELARRGIELQADGSSKPATVGGAG